MARASTCSSPPIPRAIARRALARGLKPCGRRSARRSVPSLSRFASGAITEEVVARRSRTGEVDTSWPSWLMRAAPERRRGLEREQPVAVVGLDHHFVAVAGASAARRGEVDQVVRADAPGAAVEVPEHRPLASSAAPRRRRALELGAERDRVGLRQAREISRRHGVGQAGHAGVRILRQAPERALHAREQQEQRERRRRGMRQQQTGGAQVGARRRCGALKPISVAVIR